ncbi:MAG: hypothetical protein ACLR5G_14535 [Eubacteriales bacterium]
MTTFTPSSGSLDFVQSRRLDEIPMNEIKAEALTIAVVGRADDFDIPS